MSSPSLHNYSYLYDKLNRLTNGTSDEGFNELISYDNMGNIISMNRNPVGISSYSYSGNRLIGISGAINGSYSYDANGNQTADSHKGITLAYNYLNLPETISKAVTSETMTNTWLATGAKIRKTVGGMTREYVGGIEYNDGQIEFIQTTEGRAIPTGSSGYRYEYMLKDHLGNTRVLLDEYGTVLETSDYYPFGLQVARGQTVISPENRYKYNGKELQTELGLGQYDYGARFYDPVVGRFNTVDRFAEKYFDFTPYQYGGNNPIKYIDINGDSLLITHKGREIMYQEGKVYNKDGTTYTGPGVKKDGSFKGFLKKAVDNLNTIGSGTEGRAMLSEIESSTSNVTIVQGSVGNTYDPNTNTVSFDPGSTQGGLNTRGSTDRPTFIGLGHELAHGLDDIRGTLNTSTIPGQTFSYAEHFSTHIENKLRAEHFLPLRQAYGVSSTGTGIYPIINNAGQSLFYNNYNYWDAQKAKPARLLIPASTLSPGTIK